MPDTTLIRSDLLSWGALFTVPDHDQYLRLRPYETVHIRSGHVYEMFWPMPVKLVEQVKAEPEPRRLSRPHRRQRAILGLVARPGCILTLSQIRDQVHSDLPYFRAEKALQGTLCQLVGLIKEDHHGYRATGPGLLQAIRWGLLCD